MLKIGGQRLPRAILLLVLSDCVLIALALVLATVTRFARGHDGSALSYFSTGPIGARFVVAIVVGVFSLYFQDLYDLRLITSGSELVVRTVRAFGMACIGLAVCYYILPDLGFGRGIAILAGIFALPMTLGWHLLWLRGNTAFRPLERMLVMGTAPTGINVVRDVIRRPELQMKVVGFLDEKGENIGKSLVNPGIIGATADIESIVQEQDIDRVVVSLMERRGRMPFRQLLHLKFAGVLVEDAHSFFERLTGRISLEGLSPSWLIFSEGFRKPVLLLWAKRAVDVVGSLVALIVCLPLFAIVSAAIWLESGSPVLFRQERAGYRGRSFQMFKFRSMFNNAEEAGPQWATDADRRITRVGKWIRKFRIDELPQAINVLRGEMSIVGPRPERPEFVSVLESEIPYYGLRHSVRPGITGWAQIKYQYSSNIEETKTKLEHDLFYIKHLSVMLDLAILFDTAKVMFSGKGAK